MIRRLFAPSLAVVALTCLAAAPCPGLTTDFNSGTGALSIVLGSGETAAVTAVGGLVKVNGADPFVSGSPTPTSAASVTLITSSISGFSGATTDYSGVTPGDFPALAKTSSTVTYNTSAVVGWAGTDEVFVNLTAVPFTSTATLTRPAASVILSYSGAFTASSTLTAVDELTILYPGSDDTLTIGKDLGLTALSVSFDNGNDTAVGNVQATPCSVSLDGGSGIDVFTMDVDGFLHTQFADRIEISSKATMNHSSMETVNITNTGTNTRVADWTILAE